MALALAVLLTLLLGTATRLIYGRQGFTRILIPWLIWLIGVLMLLYAKYVEGDDFVTFLLYVPSGILLLGILVWAIVLAIKMAIERESKRKVASLAAVIVSTAILIAVPAFSTTDKYRLYRSDYNAVANALFQAYDENRAEPGTSIRIPTTGKTEIAERDGLLSDAVIRRMKRLHRNSGVNDFILADKNAVFFTFSGGLQSIDGILLIRGGTIPSDSDNLKKYYQSPWFERITDEAYSFYGGR